VAAGGIWLVRNWLEFGSPLAPAGVTLAGYTIFPGETFQQTDYLSVLGEMQTNSFHLLPRARFFIDQWFGSWYLPALGPIVVLVIDLAVSARRRIAVAEWWSRFALLVITVIAGGILVWLLIGAPWTALERSHGLTLRYVLPVAALLPTLALIGCFPIGGGWHTRRGPRVVVATLLGAGALWLWWNALAHPDPTQPSAFAPGISVVWCGFAFVLMTIVGSRSGRRLATLALIVMAIAWWAPMIARADRAVRATAWSRLETEQAAYLAGTPSPDLWRQIYLALRAADSARASTCHRRRYFSLVRFDEPLALQSPDFGDLVFYAGRDVDSARRAGPMSSCDYIVTTPAVMQTDKGQALAAALAGATPLSEAARTAELVILKPAAIR
jgi:hypothetical protein